MQQQFIVYKSSAGSGKTFTLVKEYLKLALADKVDLTKTYKSILAITFTNKAAAEMKGRIIQTLKDICNEKQTPIAELISKELGIDLDELKSRAEIVLIDILHHYSDFSVSTIDSFTHRIIRTFALDLHLPVNFQIETDADSVFKKIVAALISNLGKDELITDYLVNFSLSQSEENKNWDPEKTLIDFIKEVHKEGSSELLEKLGHLEITDFNQINAKISDVIKQYEKTLKEKGEDALSLIHSKSLNDSSFFNGNKGIYNFFKKLSTFHDIKEKLFDDLFGSNVTKTLEGDKWYGGNATDEEKVNIDSIKNELQGIALFVSEYIKENQERYIVFKSIKKNMHAIGLVNELTKMTKLYKQDENILFISEFNELIAEIVTNEPAPFIFERLGDKYKHFLLDEFQDTSVMQWQNTLPLIDHSLASGKLNLIVGDGKQSIYRWRNANVEQFIDLPKLKNPTLNNIIAEREESLVRNFKESFLTKNFRSQPTIVSFNNQLFDYLSEQVLNDYFKKIYNQQKQEHKPGQKGFVSIDFPSLIDDSADKTNFHFIAKYIHEAIEDGYHYADICVIVRRNNDGNEIANFLIEQSIPVVSSDSLLLSSAKEINLILCFLKLSINHKDLLSASVIVDYLRETGFCGEKQYVGFLRDLNVLKTKTIFSILTACGLKIDATKLQTLNLFDYCLEIIHAFGFHKTNPQYIRFFLDEILSFLQSNTSNTSLFLDWWKTRTEKSSVIIPEGIDAIRIMTIHASKGLEFPVVITPYLNWKTESTVPLWITLEENEIGLPAAIINSTKDIDSTKYQLTAETERQQQALDNLNILYVDFTRAIDRLHIISPESKQNFKNTTHNWLYSFAKTSGHFDEAKRVITFGTRDQKDPFSHVSKNKEQIEIATLPITQHHHIVKIKEASLYETNEEITKARDYGVLMHHILSKIRTHSDLDLALSDAVIIGDLTRQEAEKIHEDINALLTLKEIAPYFLKETKIKTETEILTEEGKILRPDRVIIQGQLATVIDYKTGKRNPKKHKTQMNEYEFALKKLGFNPIKKILLYIQEKEVEVLE